MKRILENFCFYAALFLMTHAVTTPSIASQVTTQWAETDISRTRLLSMTTGTGGQKEIVLGVHIQLAKGWKTYWRSPGDSGIAPAFNWEGSQNISKAEILWPVPQPFESFGFRTWGFKDEVVFPIKITLKDPKAAVQVRLEIGYGICRDICVPVQQEFMLKLPNTAAEPASGAPLIQHFRNQIPQPFGTSAIAHKLRIKQVFENTLHIFVESVQPMLKPDLIVEGEDGDFFTVKEIDLSDDGKVVNFSVIADFVRDPHLVTGRQLKVTVLDQDQGAEGIGIVK